MSVDGLRNKWARDAGGLLLRADECVPDVDYRCPMEDCGSVLRLRATESDAVRAHLYHADPCSSASESWEHDMAKRVVWSAFRRWFAGWGPPMFGRACGACGQWLPMASALLFGSADAEVEGSAAGRRADVLVQRKGRAPLFVEVFHTHAVTVEKARDIATAGAQWVEVSAKSALTGAFHVVNSSGTAFAACPCQLAQKVAIGRDDLRLLRAATDSARAERTALDAEVRKEMAVSLRLQEENAARRRGIDRLKDESERIQAARNAAVEARDRALAEAQAAQESIPNDDLRQEREFMVSALNAAASGKFAGIRAMGGTPLDPRCGAQPEGGGS